MRWWNRIICRSSIQFISFLFILTNCLSSDLSLTHKLWTDCTVSRIPNSELRVLLFIYTQPTETRLRLTDFRHEFLHFFLLFFSIRRMGAAAVDVFAGWCFRYTDTWDSTTKKCDWSATKLIESNDASIGRWEWRNYIRCNSTETCALCRPDWLSRFVTRSQDKLHNFSHDNNLCASKCWKPSELNQMSRKAIKIDFLCEFFKSRRTTAYSIISVICFKREARGPIDILVSCEFLFERISII